MDNGFTRALKGGAVQVNKDIDRREVPRYGIEEAARCFGDVGGYAELLGPWQKISDFWGSEIF